MALISPMGLRQDTTIFFSGTLKNVLMQRIIANYNLEGCVFAEPTIIFQKIHWLREMEHILAFINEADVFVAVSDVRKERDTFIMQRHYPQH